MSSRTYGAEEKAKLERLVNEGVTVLQEVEDLNSGLKETVKAVAEELDIKPSLINKAIKIAQKGDWTKVSEEFDDLGVYRRLLAKQMRGMARNGPPGDGSPSPPASAVRLWASGAAAPAGTVSTPRIEICLCELNCCQHQA